MKLSNRYKELLIKFAKNEELKELFDLARLDDVREREIYYSTHKSYPEHRDLVGKILIDLYTVEVALDNKK